MRTPQNAAKAIWLALVSPLVALDAGLGAMASSGATLLPMSSLLWIPRCWEWWGLTPAMSLARNLPLSVQDCGHLRGPSRALSASPRGSETEDESFAKTIQNLLEATSSRKMRRIIYRKVRL